MGCVFWQGAGVARWTNGHVMGSPMKLAIRRFRQAWAWFRWRRAFAQFGTGSLLGKRLGLVGGQRIVIGNRVQLGHFWRLEAIEYHAGTRYTPRITLGDRLDAGTGLHIAAAESVEIGADVLIASWVFITDHDHEFQGTSPPRHSPLAAPRAVRIGDGTWLGERCVVLPGVSLGNRCVVGAGAVVTTSFDDGSVVAGMPARLIRRVSA
jgi:acetyltransferase-like isoleucine patch superfamily enzyme